MATKQYLVKGMSCQKCVRHVQNLFEDLEAKSSTVDLASETATVEWNDAAPDDEKLKAEFAEEGYQISAK